MIYRKILKDLDSHKRLREEVLYNKIQDKLNKSIDLYQKTLSENYQYLSNRNNLNVLKRVNKE